MTKNNRIKTQIRAFAQQHNLTYMKAQELFHAENRSPLGLPKNPSEELVNFGNRGNGKVFAFVSMRGGAGKTSLATAFALSLLKRKQPVEIVDLDVYDGQLRTLFKINQTEQTVNNLAEINEFNTNTKIPTVAFKTDNDSQTVAL